MFFKKNKKVEAPKTLPINEILDMKGRGMSNQQIVQALRAMGYSMNEIKDAFSQAEIKGAISQPLPPPSIPENPPMPPEISTPKLPTPPIPSTTQTSTNITPTQTPSKKVPEELVDELQRIIEEIIADKWKEVDDKMKKLDVWKATIDEQMKDFKDELDDFKSRLDDFSESLVKKGEEYKKTLNNVNVEMEALEKMMGKLVPSLADEIRKLKDIVNKVQK